MRIIDRPRWRSFDPTRAQTSLLNLPGVYVIYRGDRIKYVGQSECVRRRIHNYRFENFPSPEEFFHGFTRTPWGDWSWSEGGVTGKVAYARRYGEQLMTEARLIRRLRPSLNRRGV
jgi:hypothetical protein